MSHRLFGSFAGTASLTGLALALACSGGSEPSRVDIGPSTPIVLGPNGLAVDEGASLHRYRISATSERASIFDHPVSKDGARIEPDPASPQGGGWLYYPTRGNAIDIVTVTARNTEGVASPEGKLVMVISENHSPDLPAAAAPVGRPYVRVSTTEPVVISGFPLIDADGDIVTWTSSIAQGSFIAQGGSASIAKSTDAKTGAETGQLTITAPAANFPASAWGDYLIEFYSTEQMADGYSVVPSPGTLHTVSIRVGSESDGSDQPPINQVKGEVFGYPVGDETIVYVGIPKRFQFRARDNANVGNMPFDWRINNGGGSGSAAMQPWSWIVGQDGQQPPTNNASFQAYRNYNPNQPLQFGEAVYVPPPGSEGTNVNFGAIATFQDVVGFADAYKAFAWDVRANTAPVVKGTSNKYDDITTTVLSAPWSGSNKFGGEPAIVLQHDASSLGLSSVIKFTRTIEDRDLPAGDLLTFEYEGVWAEGFATAAQKGDDYKLAALSVKAEYDWNPPVLPTSTESTLAGAITIAKNPMEKSIQYGPSDDRKYLEDAGELTFVFSVKDLAGNEAAQKILVTVPTAASEAPVFDEYVDSSHVWSSGNATRNPGPGWASVVPAEGSTTTWTIDWSASPAPFKISSPGNQPVYMRVAQQPGPAQGAQVLDGNSNALVSPGTPFRFSWTPNESQTRRDYSFTVSAWNKYGVAAVPLVLRGVVFGTIYGKEIEKVIYRHRRDGVNYVPPLPARSQDTDSRPVDLSQWAGIVVDAFNTDTNSYNTDEIIAPGKHAGPIIATTDTKTSNWVAFNVPPGHYLVSARDRRTDSNTPTTAPVVGPAVRSTDQNLTVPGRVAYAYTSSSNPDLTTYAGSGKLAGVLDESLLGSTYYKFDLGDLDEFSSLGAIYKGTMNQIGVSTLDEYGDAIQFNYPTIGQTGFFAVATSPSDYPAGAYPEAPGWAGKLGATNGVPDPPAGSSSQTFNAIEFDFYGTISYHMTKDDHAAISVMAKDKAFGTLGSSNIDYPYWRMTRSGTPTVGGEVEYDGSQFSPEYQTSNFAAVGKAAQAFNANIDRDSFKDVIGLAVVENRDAELGDIYSKIVDTLQVIAYPNGTSLGPVENHRGVPTYLEFGDLNDGRSFGGRLNLGSIDIPLPSRQDWSDVMEATTPVVSYAVNYESPSDSAELPGSMGLITTNVSGGVGLAMRPVTNVKVTTHAAPVTSGDPPLTEYATIDTASDYVSNYYDGSGVLTRPGGHGPSSPSSIVAVQAKVYQRNDKESPKVWLSWQNPSLSSGAFSGNILEIFSLENASIKLGAESVPDYKVYLAPDVTQFPIPDQWVSALEAADKGGGGAVARIRSVRYGEGPSVINFNETPYRQALPAAWADAITCKINFSLTGLGGGGTPPTPGQWDKSAAMSFSPNAIDISAIQMAIGAQSLYAPAGPTITFSPSTAGTTGITGYNWTATTGSGTGDDTKISFTGGSTNNPAVSFAAGHGFAIGDTIKFEVTATDGADTTDAGKQAKITGTVRDLTGSTQVDTASSVAPLAAASISGSAFQYDVFGSAITITTKITAGAPEIAIPPASLAAFQSAGYAIEWAPSTTPSSSHGVAMAAGTDDGLQPKVELNDGDNWQPGESIVLDLVLKKGGATSVTKKVTITLN